MQWEYKCGSDCHDTEHQAGKNRFVMDRDSHTITGAQWMYRHSCRHLTPIGGGRSSDT